MRNRNEWMFALIALDAFETRLFQIDYHQKRKIVEKSNGKNWKRFFFIIDYTRKLAR